LPETRLERLRPFATFRCQRSGAGRSRYQAHRRLRARIERSTRETVHLEEAVSGRLDLGTTDADVLQEPVVELHHSSRTGAAAELALDRLEHGTYGPNDTDGRSARSEQAPRD
jgi:hypothetical protein